MFAITVTYVIKPGHADEASEHFRAIIAPSRAEAGNRRYHVYRPSEEPRRFYLFEEYDDEAAFESHRKTEHFLRCIKDGILTIMETRTADRCLPLDGA